MNSNDSIPVPRFNLQRVKAAKAQRRLKDFVIQGWPILEPSAKFVDGMHVDAICSHLEAITQGKISHLIINVPPGHAKSLLVCVFWPAWVWLSHPESRWLFASYRQPLAERDSLRCRTLIQSDWYQQRWGDRFQLRKDQNQKERFENDRTGYRVVVPMTAGTGERGDYVVVDDPHSVDQAESDAERIAGVDWWNGAMSTRLNDPSTGHKVVIQQRLHEADLTGDLLQRGGYQHLCLPAEFEADRRCRTTIWQDPRSEEGELLWPQRFDHAALEHIKTALGSYRYAGQFQQSPAPVTGGIFQRHWFGYWQPAHMDLPPVTVRLPDGQLASIQAVPLPEEWDGQIQSWDLSCKEKPTSDLVAGQVWGVKGADRFLLDLCCEHMDMLQTKETIGRMSQQWPQAGAKLIEDKANGPAVIQELRHEIAGLIAVTPEGGKIARARAVSAQVESGNVYLPHPSLRKWMETFIKEVTTFPEGRHDDQVDAMTQALNYLRGMRANFGVPESQILVEPFTIPDNWPQGFVIVVTPSRVVTLWAARSPKGYWFLTDEHVLSDAEPARNACVIKERGVWIPGMVHTPFFKGSLAEKHSVTQLYRGQGLQVHTATLGEEAGVYHLRKELGAQNLNVFRTLEGFLSEYRTGDEHALLLQGCFAMLASGGRFMKPKKVPQSPIYLPKIPGGERGWMA